ncbi:MAG TPA: hypothetical protein PK874_11575 [Desulfobacteraceae bacterium]|nr:hypothetical protein [Desulfobacteraceae bacterium]HPJ68713.1 hypothetical protein [Desulfobacteraceae bacterium]
MTSCFNLNDGFSPKYRGVWPVNHRVKQARDFYHKPNKNPYSTVFEVFRAVMNRYHPA